MQCNGSGGMAIGGDACSSSKAPKSRDQQNFTADIILAISFLKIELRGWYTAGPGSVRFLSIHALRL